MSQNEFHIAELEVTPSARHVTGSTNEVTLSLRAMGVLEVLAKSGTDVVTRGSLLDRVWADVIVTDESLTQAVSEIRRALALVGVDRDLIVTVPKTGYRLREKAIWTAATSSDAIASDPLVPLDAYCALMEAHTALIRGGTDAPKIALEHAKEAARRAPHSARAHASWSIMLVHAVLYAAAMPDDLDVAVAHAEKAVSRSPQLALSQAALGFALGARSGGGSAYKALSKSLMNADKSGEAHYLAARVAFVSGDHRTAATLALCSSELVSDPSRPLFLAARAAHSLGIERSSALGRRCVRALQRRLEEDPDEPRSLFTLGPALALAGDRDEAWDQLSKPRSGRSNCLIHHFFGLALLNEERRALDVLEQALDEGFRHGRWLQCEAMVAEIRSNRRFQRLMAPLVTH
ncbi:MAG: winged helix-turn-helix domain-containing protein [Pseudomonadota bacterium]